MDSPERDLEGEVVTARRDTVRAVLVLGSPIVLSNLLAWFVGFTDVLMVSRLGEAELAGLGMANQIFFLVVVLILAVTTGTMALVARFTGAGDGGLAAHVVKQSIILAGLQSLLIGAGGIAVTPALLRALGASPDVHAAGAAYLTIIFLGVWAPVLDFTIASAFRGAGDSMTPLRITGYVVVLNVIGNWLLIFGPGPFPALGVAGAALATVLARGSGAAWGWYRLRQGRGGVRLDAGSWRPDLPMMRRILRIGVPSAVDGFMRAGSGVGFIGIIARTGPGAAAVAAHTVGLQLEAFARMPSFGISVAATSLVGQRLGAGDPRGAERVGWTAAGVGIVLLTTLGLGLFLAARPLATLFSNDPQTVALAVLALRILAVAQPFFLLAVVMNGALRCGGDTAFPMWVSFLAGWLFLLPLAYWLSVVLGMGPVSAWVAQAGNYLLSAILVTLRFRGGRWKSIRV
jgi:putative MATE family efflux protein